MMYHGVNVMKPNLIDNTPQQGDYPNKRINFATVCVVLSIQ